MSTRVTYGDGSTLPQHATRSALVSIPTIALPKPAATGLPQLAPGAVLGARVVAQAADGTARLSIGRVQFDVKLPVSLVVGQQVAFRVEEAGPQPRLALLTDAGGRPLTPAAAQSVMGQSAVGQPGPATPAATVTPAAPGESGQAVTRAIAQALLGDEAGRQASMAPLFASAASAARAGIALPAEVQQALRDLMGFRLASEDLTGAGLRTAAARSGLFREARAAAGRPGGHGGAGVAQGSSAGAPDLKSALLLLRGVLGRFLQTAAGGELSGDTASEEGFEQVPGPRPRPVEPPRANGVPRGQPPVAADLPAGISPQQVARQLLGQTEGALSRLRLSQLASGPAAEESAGGGAKPPVWTFELPLGVGADTAIVQFQINREEGGGRAPGGEEQGWSLRFGLDLPQTGPVDSRIVLRGARVGVAVWAERPEVAGLLRERVETLRLGLADVGLEPGEISVHAGRPRPEPPASGHFLDRHT